MNYDIVIAGVGGQGILTIAAVMGRAVLAQGWHLKQSEVHGMAQRGGAVQAHFRMADHAIHADLIPRGRAELLMAMEPMEALRHLPWLGPEGWIVTHEEPVRNIPEYPDREAVWDALAAWPRRLMLDGVGLARAAGAPPQALNMALLGAASPRLPLPPALLEEAVCEHFAAKGDKVAELNVKVLLAGRAWAEEQAPGGAAV